jgi:AraC family transcriptional regulator
MNQNINIIQGLVNKIEENLAEEINMLNLAQSFDLSPWHFQRLFKSLVGDTLGGYVRGRRLTKAAELLLSSDSGIIDIALSVGFNSHEAFSRSFKSYFNLAPKNFRKEHPKILLNEKPLLTEELFKHLSTEITREPIIKMRESQTIIGYGTNIPSPFFSNESYCHLLESSWMNLLGKQSELKNIIPETYFGLSISKSGNFTEETVDYIAAVPVTKPGEVPEGMSSYTFPEQMVAMFEVATVQADTVDKTIEYIYGYWLPNSPYLRGQGDDYEFFEEVTEFTDPNLKSKYVIPIIPKK